MQLAALSCILRQLNLKKHLFWKLPEPHILRTKPPASWGRYRGIKVGRIKPQWPGVGSKGRTRSGASPHLVWRQWESWGDWAEKLCETSLLCLFPSFPRTSRPWAALTWLIRCRVQPQCPSSECSSLTCPSHPCVGLGRTQTTWGLMLMP